jgi:hypothetical protein
MKEQYRKICRRFYYKGHEFVIVKGLHDGILRAIDCKYLAEDGTLKQKLNGLQMFCDDRANTLQQIIKRIKDNIDLAEYIEERGIDVNDTERFVQAVKDFYRI